MPIRREAKDAGLSIYRIGATFSIQSLNRLQHVQRLSPFDYSFDASDPEGICICLLEGGRGRRRLTRYATVSLQLLSST
jgi:hypothetical protein